MKILVRFCVDYRIKPHIPLYLNNPANFFKFQFINFTTQVVKFMLTIYFNKILHNLKYRLQGYLILFTAYTFIF